LFTLQPHVAANVVAVNAARADSALADAANAAVEHSQLSFDLP
jgi:hypothetical protein